mgnify:CR=1 FL=1
MVTRETNILEAVQKYPVIAQVFQRYGLGCIGCMVASAHGLNADIVIAEINDILKKDEA